MRLPFYKVVLFLINTVRIIVNYHRIAKRSSLILGYSHAVQYLQEFIALEYGKDVCGRLESRLDRIPVPLISPARCNELPVRDALDRGNPRLG